MAINPLASYASQQVNNPFIGRGEEQARINERDDNRARERTETRRAGVEAAESQKSEARNNGSSTQSRTVESREENQTPRSRERGSLFDVTV